MRARCSIVERDDKNNIVFLKDLANQYGGITITNDAENVVDYYRSIYGNRVRVVYLDTDSEWWELDWVMHDPSRTDVRFKPWHGLVWDKLTKVDA
jgi:hypothetical protein